MSDSVGSGAAAGDGGVETALARDEFAPLDRAYLLVVNIPCYVDARGGVFLDRAWHIDLAQHLTYLPQLRIACPVLPLSAAPHADLVRFDQDPRRFVLLPPQTSSLRAFLALPRTIAALTRAVVDAEVVQSGVAGWPYPLGWISSGLAKLLRRPLVVIVESAPWRPNGSAEDRRLTRKLRARVYESVARRVCSAADLALYTQPAYRDSLHRSHGPAYIAPATWISPEHLVARDVAERAWRDKARAALRIAFIGRLAAAKGVQVLLDALALLDEAGVSFSLDFVGDGECAGAIDQAAAAMSHVRVRRLDPVAYGPEFFRLIDGYHALVVPSLGDEQPRILFDASARAVPTIASSTDGIRPHVTPGVNGWLVPPNDARSLADALLHVAEDPTPLSRWGLNALGAVSTQTHLAMHRKRSHWLRTHVGAARGRAQSLRGGSGARASRPSRGRLAAR